VSLVSLKIGLVPYWYDQNLNNITHSCSRDPS